MIHLSPGLLERSPQETARHLCLRLLQEANLTLGRFERNEDGEALHDFRVSLRRLRSLMRAYRTYLKGSIGKRQRARLSELASSTNAARDLDVQMAWLGVVATSLDAEARAGADELRERLESRARASLDRESLRATFDALHKSLAKSLSRVRFRLDRSLSFLTATGEILAGAGVAMRSSLASIHSAEDVSELHRARLDAKRLRYVLEPLFTEWVDARRLVKRMKSLQDVLGELQDTQVMTATISEELSKAALEQAQRLRDLTLQGGVEPEPVRTQSHLLALLRVQRERRERCYGTLAKEWLGESSEPFFRSLTELADKLTSSGEAPLPRRRFLLRSVPEEASKTSPLAIREGFLPGKRIRESVRAVRSGRRTRYSRRVEVRGRPAVEEALARPVFEKLWALTEGHRSERTRYEVRTESQVWHIDSIVAPELVLAEVGAHPDLELPDWLQPHVLREVTALKTYAPENLTERARSIPGIPDDPRDEAP